MVFAGSCDVFHADRTPDRVRPATAAQYGACAGFQASGIFTLGVVESAEFLAKPGNSQVARVLLWIKTLNSTGAPK